jgi:hypothetical protein
MWIRSQNKKRLVNVGMLDICDTRIFVSELPGQIPKSGICVGKYESEERAIEVLDEIQENINVLEYDKVYKSRHEEMYAQGRYVYEMPER